MSDVTFIQASPSGGSRPPVLFVHGIFVDAMVWNHWLTFFAERGVRAVAVNLRGRSGSRPGTDLGRASIEDFVDDAEAVARQVGATTVVGHSMGGLIAQKLAERGAVKAAVLITPAPPKGISVLSLKLAIKEIPHLPAIFFSRLVTPDREDLREIVMNRMPVHQQDRLLDSMIPDSGRASRDMSVTGVPVDASRVQCPIFVIGAEDDRFIPLRIVERIAKRYRAPLYVAEHHGHMVILEPDWEAIADKVEQWIREQ